LIHFYKRNKVQREMIVENVFKAPCKRKESLEDKFW